VALTGWVDSFVKKWASEGAAHRVRGVKAVANDIEVRLPTSAERTDPDLAAAMHALECDALVPSQNIHVTVTRGWLTLSGEVEWEYQRRAAERAVRRLSGVRGVTNQISLRPRMMVDLAEQQRRIEKALVRTVDTPGERLTVAIEGDKVILTGVVRSWRERDEAERIAWSAPGVTSVENRIVVMPEAVVAACGACTNAGAATTGARRSAVQAALAAVWTAQVGQLAPRGLGAYALINGTLHLAGAFSRSQAGPARLLLVLTGLLGIAAALMTLLWPAITALALAIVIGVSVIATGALDIWTAVRPRASGRGRRRLDCGRCAHPAPPRRPSCGDSPGNRCLRHCGRRADVGRGMAEAPLSNEPVTPRRVTRTPGGETMTWNVRPVSQTPVTPSRLSPRFLAPDATLTLSSDWKRAASPRSEGCKRTAATGTPARDCTPT
jgi:osmotically-inducible protein OsmY